jgi:hypothetical protein
MVWSVDKRREGEKKTGYVILLFHPPSLLLNIGEEFPPQ